MAEDKYVPLQTRRSDLILPIGTTSNQTRQKKQVKLELVKPTGFLGRCVLLFITIASFVSVYQTDILWSQYDTVERTAYQSMQSWKEAWSIQSIRTENPLAISSYFLEQKISANSAIVHRGINLTLHILAAFLLLNYLNALKAPGALVATLVFSTHPAVSQTLFWAGYRTEIIGLIFILMTLLSSIQTRGSLRYLITLILATVSSLIHPAAMVIPVIMMFVVFLQNRKFKLKNFTPVLPFICIALLLAVWTQGSQTNEITNNAIEANIALNKYGENMFFYLKQTVFPIAVGLFHPVDGGIDYNVSASFSLLPFLFFVPFYLLAFMNFKKTWARATLLGITAYLVLCMPGVFQEGKFLDGTRALETHGLYVALPALISLIFCGLSHFAKQIGAAGKLLWLTVFSVFFLIQLTVTVSFAYSVSQPTTMWQGISEHWSESWIPKAALIKTIQEEKSDLLSSEQQIGILNSILAERPKLTEERTILARAYREAGQKSNAVREYKRLLLDTKISNEILAEAANFYEQVGLYWDARNARERIQN